jgi:predicted nucleic acid-binding protein
VSPLLRRVASLSGSLSAYDAAFVAVAELSDAPLVTTDARLARAPGPRCEFLLVEAN